MRNEYNHPFIIYGFLFLPLNFIVICSRIKSKDIFIFMNILKLSSQKIICFSVKFY